MKPTGPIKVTHGPGPNTEAFTGLDGKTVASVRAGLKDAFSISEEARATVNGKPVGDDHVLQPGDRLEFGRPSR